MWVQLLQAHFCHLAFPRHILDSLSMKTSQSSFPLWDNQLPITGHVLAEAGYGYFMIFPGYKLDYVQGLFQRPHSIRALISVAYPLPPIPQSRPILWFILKDAFTELRDLVRSQRPLSAFTSVILCVTCRNAEQTFSGSWSKSLSWTIHIHVCPAIPCCFIF